ncbi:alpha/beta hydrolase family protein [Acinetobacter johnsonii]|uniref:alpha/beta hydrolase family protein n=1 Tax=Acinetobacter johnsonii TaxID=40214 RepID=UPI003F54626C
MMKKSVTSSESTEAKSEYFQFKATDGYILTGIKYLPCVPKKANLVIASATGVPQEFYQHFARYMAKLGYEVLSFDYRGINKSAPESLKKFKMNYLDWGTKDLSSLLDQISDSALPLFLIGHSFGGQALGLVTNHHRITACYSLGTGIGWPEYMPYFERFKIKLLTKYVMPLMVKRHGYMAWSKLNMGVDLPSDVFKQWQSWSQYPEYFFDDPKLEFLIDQYSKVKTKIFAATSLDDEWATPKSRNEFMKYYSNAEVHLIDIDPKRYGSNSIGHMGYFKKNAQPIWQSIIQTLESILNKEQKCATE